VTEVEDVVEAAPLRRRFTVGRVVKVGVLLVIALAWIAGWGWAMYHGATVGTWKESAFFAVFCVAGPVAFIVYLLVKKPSR